jgi:hypothetical protein
MSRRDRPDEGRPMATECCGKPRDTPFCPRCGGRLAGESPLDELLRHIRVTERNSRAQQERWSKPRPGNDPSDVSPTLAERKRATADKWKAWGDALARLMAAEE